MSNSKPSKVQQISLLQSARVKLSQLRSQYALATGEHEDELFNQIEEVKHQIAEMAFNPKMQVMNGRASLSNSIINGMV